MMYSFCSHRWRLTYRCVVQVRNEFDVYGEPVPLPRVHRTPTVVSIGPLCPTDPMVRSCSVGYLDLVDAQLVPCDVALKMLRKDAPNKRLVLVSRKTKKRKKTRAQQEAAEQSFKPPRLRQCGKSKSLDSSDIFPTNEQIALAPKLSEHKEESCPNNFELTDDLPPSPGGTSNVSEASSNVSEQKVKANGKVKSLKAKDVDSK